MLHAARHPRCVPRVAAPERRVRDDGRSDVLLRHEAVFHAILLDPFADRTAMPAHLYTREFFDLLRSRLAEAGGTLYMNLIVAPGPDRLSTRIDRPLRTVFARCGTHDEANVWIWHNRVYRCTRHPLDGDAGPPGG